MYICNSDAIIALIKLFIIYFHCEAIFKPRQHINSVFCGDGRHKVEEDHAQQGENQIQFSPNPEMVLETLGNFLPIMASPVSQRAKDESATEEAKHEDRHGGLVKVILQQ